jgi:hypothetical protein
VKPSTQGETKTQTPAIRLSHSSQNGKCGQCGDRYRRNDNSADKGVLRGRATRKSKDPGRHKEDCSKDQIGDVTELGIAPFIHDVLLFLRVTASGVDRTDAATLHVFNWGPLSEVEDSAAKFKQAAISRLTVKSVVHMTQAPR